MLRIKHTAIFGILFFFCTILSVLYAVDRRTKNGTHIIYQAAIGESMGKVFVHSEAKVTLELPYFFSNLGENEMTDYIFKIDRRLPYLLDASGEKIFLVLRNPEVCFVFKNNLGSQHLGAGEYIFAGIEQGIWNRYVLTYIDDVQTSSFLKEEATATRPRMSYEASNLIRFSLDAPWVENVPGQGIGETIRFSTYDEEEGGFPAEKAVGFYVCNGFISFVRPDLYEKNSRVKEFKVTDIKTKKSKSVFLEDTPNPQFIDISEFQGTDVELEIKDVYPGTRWQDTCVAGIVLKRRKK